MIEMIQRRERRRGDNTLRCFEINIVSKHYFFFDFSHIFIKNRKKKKKTFFRKIKEKIT